MKVRTFENNNLIQEIEVRTAVPAPVTVEQLQATVEDLKQQLLDVQNQLEVLTGQNADPNSII